MTTESIYRVSASFMKVKFKEHNMFFNPFNPTVKKVFIYKADWCFSALPANMEKIKGLN